MHIQEDTRIRLLLLIEDQLGWGHSLGWPSRDFEKLSVLIQENTKIALSASTLRRVWGKVDYTNQPSVTTMDTLAQFAGFENWRAFSISVNEPAGVGHSDTRLPETSAIRPIYWIGIFVFAIILIKASIVFIRAGSTVLPEDYSFGYRPVTHDLPNSVIFSYDAHKAPNDSVFIQQSWDNTRRTRVSKTSHLFSSLYYKPGFYHAKLVIGSQIVKEMPLLIPTNGWLGMIDQQPVPLYLDQYEFKRQTGMAITTATILQHKVALEPQPPVVSFYNTGNFKPLSILNFSYTAEVKNDYKTGASRCQELHVILFTSGIPISIPLSAPGCIASLSLLDGVKEIDASFSDLSAFGTDLTKWVKISCISCDGQITILVNHKMAYQYPIPDKKINILGLGFLFHGTGSVRHITLSSNRKAIFQAF